MLLSSNRRAKRPDCSTNPLGLLGIPLAFYLVLTLVGCRPQPPPTTAQPARATTPVLTPAYVNLQALAPLHPAQVRLRDLDRQISMLQAGAPAAPIKSVQIDEPPPAELPVPAAPKEAAPPPPIDRQRDEAEIKADYDLRRQAQAAQPDTAYQEELDRIRRRLRQLRLEIPVEHQEQDLQRGMERAREMQRLEAQIRSLREQLDPRFFRPREALAAAREELKRVQAELDRLKREQIEELRASLEAPPTPSPQHSAAPERMERELLDRAERARKQREEQDRAGLLQAERRDLEQLSRTTLPSPPEATPVEVPHEEATEAREQVAAAIRSVRESKPAPPPGAGAAINALRSERERLAQAMMEDLRDTAAAAGRTRGLQLTFARGRAPDRTAELQPLMRQILQGRRQGKTR